MFLSESQVSDSFDDPQSIDEPNHHSQSIDEPNHHSVNDAKSNGLEVGVQRRSASEEKSSIKKQCAIMYKNDEPVGVLQPYKDTYQFLPLHSDEHIAVDISPYADSQNAMKRDTSNTEADKDAPEVGDADTLKKDEDGLQFSDDRYPYIFAKFKVDSRIEKPYGSGVNRQRTLPKRDLDQSLAEERRSDSLSSTLSKIQTNTNGAEGELRSILSDMGLIDDDTHLDKREAELNEDEDLEQGTNKINLIKLDNIEERPKRDDEVKTPEKRETATKHYEMIEIPEPKTINEEEYIDQYLHKNEEQSEEHDKQNKEKRSDHMADQIEHEIKSKLQRIKEEVRNEIEKIKTGNNEEFEESVDDEAEHEEETEEKEKLQRRKRDAINTLTDEETSDIDPVLSAGNNLVPHIRKRRKRTILNEDVLSDNKEDLMEESKISKNEAQRLNNPVDSKTSVSVVDKTETNLIVDLNPETKSTKEPNNVIRQKRTSNEEPSLELTQERNDEIEETGRDERDVHERVPQQSEHPLAKMMNNWKRMALKSYQVAPDRLTELENLQYRRSITENLTGNSTYESTRPTNEHLAGRVKHFLTRVLQEYDDDNDEAIAGDDDANFEEIDDDKNDKASANEDENLNREKKSCKCANGGKDCAKCGKAPLRLLKGSDGTNFVYIDDVPRLADGPRSFKIVNENEENDDKENPTVKIKFMPVPPEKKRSPKDYRNYRKSVIKFQKSLRDGKYILDVDPDIYRITEENSKAVASRRKRNSFSDLVAIHGGGPVINHLVAIRERSMLPRIRVKRSATKDQASHQQLTLTDMSDEDLFGALPQGFEGELARYKRVKRN